MPFGGLMAQDEAALVQLGEERGVPTEVSGDGNCLVHSISVALTGTQGYSNLLRLAAYLHLVWHRERFIQEITDRGLALLLVTEGSQQGGAQDAALEQRRAAAVQACMGDSLAHEHLEVLLDFEIQRTRTLACDLGFIQVWALAVALKRPIRCVARGPLNAQTEPVCRRWDPWEGQGEEISIAWVKAQMVA
jgi:hypothetical protein